MVDQLLCKCGQCSSKYRRTFKSLGIFKKSLIHLKKPIASPSKVHQGTLNSIPHSVLYNISSAGASNIPNYSIPKYAHLYQPINYQNYQQSPSIQIQLRHQTNLVKSNFVQPLKTGHTNYFISVHSSHALATRASKLHKEDYR